MGFHYIGPINGHNLSELNEVFQNVKNNLLDMGVDECKIVEY